MSSSVLTKITIPLKNGLKAHATNEGLVSSLVAWVKENIPNYEILKTSLELLEQICQLIENSVPKGNSKATNKVNKKWIVIKVFQALFEQVDVGSLDNQIEYMVQNFIIKKQPFLKKALSLTFQWIQKKVLD